MGHGKPGNSWNLDKISFSRPGKSCSNLGASHGKNLTANLYAF